MVEGITLKNLDTGMTLEIDMVSTPDYVLESVDWGVIEASHHSYKYVNQVGVQVTGTTLETRPIEILGWIIAETPLQMTERKDKLNQFFNPQQWIELSYKKYTLKFLSNGSVKYSIAPAENNEVICKFKIDGLCPDPLFEEHVESQIDAASTIAKFHFPLIISKDPNPPGGMVFGIRQPSLIVPVVNKGAVPVGMKILFRAKGVVVNPMITNVKTQKFFRINKSMVADEKILVNTLIGEKKIVGTIGETSSNYFKYRDFDSEWLQLSVGENLFRYDADSGLDRLEVYIYFGNKYLEVQECF